MTVSDFLFRVVWVTAVFGFGFGAGRNFSNESGVIMVVPACFTVLAIVAHIAADQARRAVAEDGATEQSGSEAVDRRER